MPGGLFFPTKYFSLILSTQQATVIKMSVLKNIFKSVLIYTVISYCKSEHVLNNSLTLDPIIRHLTPSVRLLGSAPISRQQQNTNFQSSSSIAVAFDSAGNGCGGILTSLTTFLTPCGG
jgi:hypothetical protein